MDNKTDLFDLKREKLELDNFLATIADAETAPPSTSKGAAKTREAISSSREEKSDSGSSAAESFGLQLEMSAEKPEGTHRHAARQDKARTHRDNEFIPNLADAIILKPSEEKAPPPEITSSFLPHSEWNKTEVTPPWTTTTGAHVAKPLESLKTITRFDGTTKSDKQASPDTLLTEIKKTTTEGIEVEKKVDQPSPYDFAPEKKKVGMGKRIFYLIILLVALLAGYFWLYPERGSESIDAVKSYIPGLTGSDGKSSSVKEVQLLNVRQRLITNIKLRKSIRVIEGIAENSASHPISKIKIVANLYGAQGDIVASMENVAGHILIDGQLENLDAAGILAALKAGKISEEKIPPKGQVPFMIVFPTEPGGIFKLSVTPVDFKKN